MISAVRPSGADVAFEVLRADCSSSADEPVRPPKALRCANNFAQSPSGISESRSIVSEGRSGRSTALLLLACVSLIGGLCWPWLADLVRVWRIDPNYSHGPLVPLVSLALAWSAWKRGGAPLRRLVSRRDTLGGSAELILALTLNLVAWLVGNLLLSVLALVAMIRGSLLVLGGRETNRRFGFAAVFLIFMAPLPMAWYQSAAVQLQQIVAAVSANTLRLSGVAVMREGSIVHLPGYSMEIGAACSGISQMTAFLALAALAAYGLDCRRTCRFAIVMAAVPVAVAANMARVVLTGWILIFFGAEAADGAFHTLEGMATIAVGALFLGFIVSALLWLDRSFDHTPERANEAKSQSHQPAHHATPAEGTAKA